MNQEIKHIHIKDLVLWTENPRDPIDKNAKDQDVVNRALDDNLGIWSLDKLAKAMGDYYDFSELPTVVYHDNKPIVYDGNRRIILGKIKHSLVSVLDGITIQIPDFPEQIPCNVCSKKIALRNILRKHGRKGPWRPLERDIFLHRFMEEEKSAFLILEEDTGIISANPHLNQGFVKKEVLNEDMLKKIGFSIKNGHLHSKHNKLEEDSILSDISQKIEKQVLTTRENRGKVVEVLEPSSQELIDQNKSNEFHPSYITYDNINKPQNINRDIKKIKDAKSKRQSRRTHREKTELFGRTLYLRKGEVSDLYRDIVDLYKFYVSKQNKLSSTFPNLIRMSLRLLCETAAKDKKTKLDNFLKSNFAKAKEKLTQNQKTTLAAHNITDKSIMQLIHAGAHNYDSSSNIEQTVALSIMLGAILTQTHGKSE